MIKNLFLLLVLLVSLRGNFSLAETIAAGGYHTVLLGEDGRVWTFGHNEFGQLGLGNYDHQNRPQMIPGIENIKAVAAGYVHVVLLGEDGRVWTFGYNKQGQLGHGRRPDQGRVLMKNRPQMIPGIENIKAVAAGGSHTVLLGEDGRVWTFGSNLFAQLGLANIESQDEPQMIPGIENIKAVAAGGLHTVLLGEDGRVYMFGHSIYDGKESEEVKKQNHIYLLPSMENIKAVAANGDETYLLDEAGQLSIATLIKNTESSLNNPRLLEVKIETITQFANIKAVATSPGSGYGVLLREDGRVMYSDSSGFKLLPDIENIKAMATGMGERGHTVLLRGDGQVLMFGDNFFGQLGLGHNTNMDSPQLLDSSIVVRVERTGHTIKSARSAR